MRPLLISGDRAGFPPSATCTLAIRSGRFTSTAAARLAQIAVVARRRGERVNRPESVTSQGDFVTSARCTPLRTKRPH